MALSVRREFPFTDTRLCGSVSSGLVTSRCTTPRSTDEVHRIAHEALQDHRKMFGNPLETPSLKSILDAFERDGNGDTKLLMAILQAKREEDERVTAHYDLQAANLNHVRQHRKIQISNRSSPFQPRNGGAIERQSSSSSSSSPSTAITAPLANKTKRYRDSSEERMSKGDTMTAPDGKAPKAKIIRLTPLKLSHTPSSSVKTFSAQSGSSVSSKSSAPLENASTCRSSSESPASEPLLTPRSSCEGSTPAILDNGSPRSSPLSFSLARLLNDPVTVTSHPSP